jgi:hypothetical protein
MDLFVDKSYKLHCESKLDYHQILHTGNGTLPSGYTLSGASGHTLYRTEYAIVVYQPSGIASVKIVKNSTGAYMDEFRISATAKKFVLE